MCGTQKIKMLASTIQFSHNTPPEPPPPPTTAMTDDQVITGNNNVAPDTQQRANTQSMLMIFPAVHTLTVCVHPIT